MTADKPQSRHEEPMRPEPISPHAPAELRRRWLIARTVKCPACPSEPFVHCVRETRSRQKFVPLSGDRHHEGRYDAAVAKITASGRPAPAAVPPESPPDDRTAANTTREVR